MKNNKKLKGVQVFGHSYTINLLDEPNEAMYMNTWDGYCDYDNKQIYVLKTKYYQKVLLHELIHAYINESGHRELSNNEYVVELFTEIVQRLIYNNRLQIISEDLVKSKRRKRK